MIVWFQFERQDGTHLMESDPLKTLPSWDASITQSLYPQVNAYFSGEKNDAGMQTAARVVVKADGYQVTIRVTHPDRLVCLPLNFRPLPDAERNPMKRLSRLVSR